MSKYLLCATEEEKELFKNLNIPVVKTGPGKVNIIKTMQLLKFNNNDIVYNVGFAASNIFEPGTIIKVKTCELLHKCNEIKQPVFELSLNGYTCYTSDKFEHNIDFKIELLDMELYYICCFFQGVISYKIVSDNFNLDEYNKNIKIKNDTILEFLEGVL